jgi:hypothetical protein
MLHHGRSKRIRDYHFNDQQNQSRGSALLAGVTLVLIPAQVAAPIPKSKGGGRLQCAPGVDMIQLRTVGPL